MENYAIAYGGTGCGSITVIFDYDKKCQIQKILLHMIMVNIAMGALASILLNLF